MALGSHYDWKGCIILKSRRYTFIYLIGLFLSLAACQKEEANTDHFVVAPHTPMPSQSPSPALPAAVVSASAAPVQSATPSARPSEDDTSAASSFSMMHFLPAENAFMSFTLLSAKQDAPPSTGTVFVEYIKSDAHGTTIQKRTFYETNKAPSVDVWYCDDNALIHTHHAEDIGYTYHYLDQHNLDEILLQQPIQTGTTWDTPDGQSSITSIHTQIDIPLGRISTVEVTTKQKNGQTRKQYFAEGIGLVAEYHMDEQSQIVFGMEAKERELNRRHTQRIRFFFPDQASLDIKYRTQDVNMDVNMDIPRMFTEKLSLTPSTSTLVPLSSSVSIRSIRLTSDAVHVDFSSELVTQMDLPRQTEKLLLQSLANTFGEYYQRNKVYITVEDETYESRYFLLMDGEYLVPQTSETSPY